MPFPKLSATIAGFLLILSCSQPQVLHKSQWIMGTVVDITWVGTPDDGSIIKKGFESIKNIDRLMNPDSESSELAAINAHAGKGFLSVDPLTCKVIHEGSLIWKETNGAFDITLGPIIRLWGWDTKSPHLPSRESIKNSLEKTGGSKVSCDPYSHRVILKQAGMALDLGGIAKGFAVDRAAVVMKKSGILNFIINAGGDLYVSGMAPSRSWRIGIQDPDNPRAIIASLPLSNQAIATSGDYERFFIKDKIRYHHILNPETGYPARGLRSVSVLAKTTMEADALATALFVMGRRKAILWLSAHPGRYCILLDTSARVYTSKSLRNLIKWKKRFKNRVSYF